MIEIYVGATYNPSMNMGGWGVVVIEEDELPKKHNGCEEGATQNRMILKAAIEGLSKTEQGCEVKLRSNSDYLLLGIQDSRQRKANRDLWAELDELVGRCHVYPEHVAKHKWLKEAQMLTKDATGS